MFFPFLSMGEARARPDNGGDLQSAGSLGCLPAGVAPTSQERLGSQSPTSKERALRYWVWGCRPRTPQWELRLTCKVNGWAGGFAEPSALLQGPRGGMSPQRRCGRRGKVSAEVGRGRQLLRQRENLIRRAAGPHRGSGRRRDCRGSQKPGQEQGRQEWGQRASGVVRR